MGAGSVLGKDMINKVIKGFSRLVAATKSHIQAGVMLIPHVPPHSLACSIRLWELWCITTCCWQQRRQRS